MTYAELGSALPKAGGIIVSIVSPEKTASFTPFMTGGWGKMLTVMGFSLIGFEGYEVITNTAEEVIDAKKNVNNGIFYAVIIIISTYLLVAFAAIAGGGQEGVSLTELFRLRGVTGFAEAVGLHHSRSLACHRLFLLFHPAEAEGCCRVEG